jgi:hypothetical protein
VATTLASLSEADDDAAQPDYIMANMGLLITFPGFKQGLPDHRGRTTLALLGCRHEPCQLLLAPAECRAGNGRSGSQR